jgi:predicted nucleic acid-binding protein
VIIADTSGLLALFNDREPQHKRVRRCLDETTEALVVSPYVLAELDYLISTRIGVAAELAMLRELTSPAYELVMVNAADLGIAAGIVERYHESNVGLTDASLVVLAGRYHTHRILTLDHRHFHALRALDGERFELCP